MLPILSALQYQQNATPRNHDKLKNNEHKNFIHINRKNINCKTSKIDKSIDKSDLTSLPSKSSLPLHPPLVKPKRDQKSVNKSKLITKVSQNNGDNLKSSLDRLGSIISKGELERLIQLASDIKSNDDSQSTHLYKLLTSDINKQILNCLDIEKSTTQPVKTKTVHREPVHIPGLDELILPQSVNNKDTIANNPDVNTAHQTNKPIEKNNQTLNKLNVEQRNYGRGQGLRQLLELDVSYSNQPNTDNTSSEINNTHFTEYYPWGKPGCGAPLESTVHQKSNTIRQLEDNSSHHYGSPTIVVKDYSTSNIIEPSSVTKSVSIENSDYEEKRKKNLRYKKDLESQVEEKERKRVEEREKIARAEQIENERVFREQEQLLQDAEKEKERQKLKELAAKERYEFLQRRIEEMHQKSLKRKREKAVMKQTSASDSNFPFSKPTIQNFTLSCEESITDTTSGITQNTFKDSKLHKQTEIKQSSKANNIYIPQTINPPPTQLNVLQSPRTHKSSVTKPTNLNSEKLLKKPSASLKASSMNELYNENADLVDNTQHNKGVLTQLRQLKQNLHMKKQQVDYEDGMQREII